MNKPDVKPPKGWRWLEPNEKTKAGDSIADFFNSRHVCKPFQLGDVRIGKTEKEYGRYKVSWFIRRIRRAPAKSLAAVLYEIYVGDEWRDAHPNTQNAFRLLARAARRHIAREGKR